MVTKEEIKKEVDNLPNNLLEEVYVYLKEVTEKSKEQASGKEIEQKWERWWENLKNFSPDFMNERNQPKSQARENLFE